MYHLSANCCEFNEDENTGNDLTTGTLTSGFVWVYVRRLTLSFETSTFNTWTELGLVLCS